jgi:hypothetical protein
MKTKCSGMDVNGNPAMIDVFELIPDGIGCTDWRRFPSSFPFSGTKGQASLEC